MAKGPLARELFEIGEGRRDFPKSAAKRHHFVPAFLLAQFALPVGDRRGWMYQLDTRSGKPQKTTPDSAAYEKYLYAQDSDDGRDNTLEAFFSIVEKHSAAAIQRLVEDPLHLSEADRETLSLFIAFQYSRSPVALTHLGNTSQVLSDAMFGVHFEDPADFHRVYREAIEEEASDEEIERIRQYMIERLQSGAIRIVDRKAQAFELLLLTADAVAETVYGLQWILLEAGTDEFVSSDRALALSDPSPRFPWSGHALRSSPDAQTTLPLGPRHALLLGDGPPRMGKGTLDSAEVRRVNLRTYGWAERFIFGRTQAVVTTIRSQAKRYPSEVERPRPPRQVMLYPADPDDPTVGVDNVSRGWPKGFWVRGEDGQPEYVSYVVLDPSDRRRSLAAIAGGEIGRRVIESAIADGKAPPDRLTPPGSAS